jgi:hypothetical protein
LTLIKFKRPEYKDAELELVARLLDRAESEGTVNSVIPENKSILGLQDGFIVTFMEDDNGYEGLAYKQERGKDVELKTGRCKTRNEAGYKLFSYIRAWNKSL